MYVICGFEAHFVAAFLYLKTVEKNTVLVVTKVLKKLIVVN
jgi:hypothetical protein